MSDALDPHDLRRFVDAQARDHDTALAELRAGCKQTHWIWYVLPQLRGLGSSRNATFWGITGLDEARAYLRHPLLGPRLVACVEAIQSHPGRSAADILGPLDAMKLRSCLTLFARAADDPTPFVAALDRHFGGEEDPRTVERLRGLG